jgi:hypothetical protein
VEDKIAYQSTGNLGVPGISLKSKHDRNRGLGLAILDEDGSNGFHDGL